MFTRKSSHYKKEVKARKYRDYTKDDQPNSLEDVKSKKLTQEQVAAKYDFSRRTIGYKFKENIT